MTNHPVSAPDQRSRPTIAPSVIGEYISFEQCDRYYGFAANGIADSRYHSGDSFTEAFRPLNPLLAKAGDDFEQRVADAMAPEVRAAVDFSDDSEDGDDPTDADDQLTDLASDSPGFNDHQRVAELVSRACRATPPGPGGSAPAETGAEGGDDATDIAEGYPPTGAPWMCLQTTIETDIGAWHLPGDADLILIWPTPEGALLRVFDIKSAREQKTYQRIQTTCYAIAIEDLLERVPVPAALLDEREEADSIAEFVTVEAGVITRRDPFDTTDPDTLPVFDSTYYRSEIRRLCAPDGELWRLETTDFDSLDYQLEQKCGNCPYNEACYTDAIQEASPRLLGLSPGELDTLADYGIESLVDLAELSMGLGDEQWDPRNFDVPGADIRDRETYRQLMSDPAIGGQFPDLIYRAQSLLGELGYQGVEVHTGDAPWLPRSGYGDLPDDDPAPGFNFAHQRGSMVRVYLNVQRDHLRDRLIQVSGRVTATGSTADPVEFAHLASDAPEDEASQQAAERDLLHDVIESLYSAIETVADGLDLAGVDQSGPLVHVYLFDGAERSALEEALERHDTPLAESARTLLDGRAGADQPMVSTVRRDARTRKALKTPTPGLLFLCDQLHPEYASEAAKARTSWSYTPDATGPEVPDEVDLTDAFGYRLFNRWTARGPPDETGTDATGQSVDHEGPPVYPDGRSRDHEARVPARVRFGAQIPLGYIWSAIGRIDDQWVADLEDTFQSGGYDIDNFRYHDGDGEYPIREEDVETLGIHLAQALEHVERSLTPRSGDVGNQKEPIDVGDLPGRQHTPPTLAEAARDYLSMEYAASREENYQHYRKPRAQRILTGKTIPVEVTDIDRPDNDDYDFEPTVIEGELIHEQLPFENGEQLRRSVRHKEADGTTGGSWVVVNRRRDDVHEPDDLEQGAAATIQELDPDTGRIVFTVRPSPQEGEFTRHHHFPTYDRSDADGDRVVYFTTGERYYLEPQTDEITAERAAAALDHADSNHLHDLLEGIRHGTQQRPTTPAFPAEHLDAFADWLADSYGAETFPTGLQREAITMGEPQAGIVQGPPGTGKTGGTLGPAVVGRCVAAERGRETGISALATGPSNKAIDELLEATVEVLEAYRDSDQPGLDDIQVYRLADDRPEDAPESEVLTYLDYHDADQEDVLREVGERLGLRQDATLTGGWGGGPEHTLVFASPTRAWGLIEKCLPESPDDDEIAAAEPWDLLAVDEGSMLTTPRFLLAGAGLGPDGQVLVGGDQRQLPPVQQHDWDDERRRRIREAVPHLSALDYLGFLRGEEVLEEEAQDHAVYEADPEAVTLPRIPLDRTFRYGETTTEFLRRHVYEADNIEYEADHNPGPVATAVPNDAVRAILGRAPISVVVYDDESHQMVNPIETALISHLISLIDAEANVGVVTPHNGQRGRLSTAVDGLPRVEVPGQGPTEIEDGAFAGGPPGEGPATTVEGATRPEVETVERFQGDENEVMFASGTVSDPEFIADESEFLLNLNRVNVAMSRHESKLVVVAARSLFEHIPDDTDDYENARLWKALAAETGITDPAVTPDWEGDVAAVLQGASELDLDDGSAIPLTVYTLRGD